jgi:hypothetical protein
MAIWYILGIFGICILWQFGIFYGSLVLCGNFGTFFAFWLVVPREIWQTCARKPALMRGEKVFLLKKGRKN